MLSQIITKYHVWHLAFFLFSGSAIGQTALSFGYTYGDFYQLHLGLEKEVSKDQYGVELLYNISDNGDPASQSPWAGNWHPFSFDQLFGLGVKYGRLIYEYDKLNVHLGISCRTSRMGIRNYLFVPSASDSTGKLYYELHYVNIEEPFWSLKPQLQLEITMPISKSLMFSPYLGGGATLVWNHKKGDTVFIMVGSETVFTEISYSFGAQIKYLF